MTADGERAATPQGSTRAAPSAERVVAVVRDLFFVARIRETARLARVPLEFARTPDALDAALAGPVRFALVDLTGGFDYEAVFAALEARRVPAFAFTTHALARETRPWHARCARVVTKETLTQELGTLLRTGIPPADGMTGGTAVTDGEGVIMPTGSDR